MGSVLLPIIYIYKVLCGRWTSMFIHLYAGLLLYILGTVSMLAIDLAGHLHSVDDQGTGSHCMFSYTRSNTSHALIYPILKMHWEYLFLQMFFLD